MIIYFLYFDVCVLFHRFRIRNCLTQLHAKDITPDDKQELDEALQREVCRCQKISFVTTFVFL